MLPYDAIEIQNLDTSYTASKYLLVHNGRYFEANQSVVTFLRALQNADDMPEARQKIRQHFPALSDSDISAIVKARILPVFDTSRESMRHMFKKELVSSESIAPVTSRLKVLFTPSVLYTVLTLSVLVELLFYLVLPVPDSSESVMTVWGIIGMVLFVGVSSFFHELGHASACRWAGVGHGGIGISLYINIPVLYTDVTPAWSLSRRNRFFVNMGGAYFQCFLLLALLCAYVLTASPFAYYLITILNISFIVTLNPLFKFDGYWILSDLLGIPNLRARSKKILLSVFTGRRRKSVAEANADEMRTGVKAVFIAYTLIVNVFLCYYVVVLLPQFAYSVVTRFPEIIATVFLYLSHSIAPPTDIIKELFTQLLLILLLFCFLKPVVQRYGGRIIGKLRAALDR